MFTYPSGFQKYKAPAPRVTLSTKVGVKGLNKKQKKQVKRIALNVSELHMINALPGASMSPTSTTPTIQRLSGVAQGDNVGSRSGNEINMEKLECRFQILINNGTLLPVFVRMIIFRDLDQDGTVPAFADVIQDYSGNDFDVLRPINRTSVSPKRIQVLRDKLYRITPYNTVSAFGQNGTNLIKHIVIKRKCKIHYIGTTNAQGSDGHGSIYVVFLTNAVAAPAVNFSSQMFFRE